MNDAHQVGPALDTGHGDMGTVGSSLWLKAQTIHYMVGMPEDAPQFEANLCERCFPNGCENFKETTP